MDRVLLLPSFLSSSPPFFPPFPPFFFLSLPILIHVLDIKTDEKQELVFIPTVRIDGLARRVEYYGKKVSINFLLGIFSIFRFFGLSNVRIF
jgi:hypothetical protein